MEQSDERSTGVISASGGWKSQKTVRLEDEMCLIFGLERTSWCTLMSPREESLLTS